MRNMICEMREIAIVSRQLLRVRMNDFRELEVYKQTREAIGFV